MITNSFIFLEHIDSKTEENIWKQGIKDWNEFHKRENIKGISDKRKLYYDRKLSEAAKALFDYNSTFFNNLFPPKEAWRLYDHFRDDAVFLDIEVSSSGEKGFITVIGLFDGINTKVMIKDINLDIKALKEELKKYKLIITFNGNVFDLPFIKKRYPDLLPNIPCIDLRFLCNSLGLKGGLKDIELTLGLGRENEIIRRIKGGDALLLWKMFKGSGDEDYLKLLVEYNEEDVISLKPIMEYVYKKKKAKLLPI